MLRYLRYLLLMFLAWECLPLPAQPRFRLTTYDESFKAVSSVSRIVRDEQGMMWFSTNDGLYRFDGYDFRNFKSHSGDGLNMSSNRITSMYPSSNGSIWCIVGGRVFLFDTRTYCYIDVMGDYEQKQGQTYHIDKLRPLPCGTTWLFAEDGKVFALNDARPTTSIQLMAEHETTDGMTVVCDSKQRSWVLTSQHTYLFHDGQLKRFDQTFRQILAGSPTVWLLDQAGHLHYYDEDAGKIRRLKMLEHLLDASRQPVSVEGFTQLSDGRVALFFPRGLMLMAADGKSMALTDVNWPVQKIMEDGNGHLWIHGRDGRLSMGDMDGRSVRSANGFHGKKCNLMRDQQGNVWFFSEQGDAFYSDSSQPEQLVRFEGSQLEGDITNTINDGQGGYWFIHKSHAYRLAFESQHFKRLPMHKADQVRSLIVDQHHLLATTRNEQDISVYSKTGQPVGWLGRDGRINSTWQSFGAAVYCSFKDKDGTLWLGTKRDGIFRLLPRHDGSYQVSQFRQDEQNPYSISDNEVYAFAADPRGRLWVGTRHGGLCCVTNPQAEELRFVHAENELKGWTASLDAGVKSLLTLSSGILLAGTYEGLFVADVNGEDLKSVVFKKHNREAHRLNSLSSSAISDIVQVKDGRIFLSTEDGGINEIQTKDLLADQIDFRHYDLTTGFPSDITRAMAEADSALWVTAANQLIELRLKESTLPDINTYLISERPRFSVAKPAHLSGSLWAFGAEDGALLIDLKELKSNSFVPPLVITGVSKEGGPVDFAVSRCDTIRLSSDERDVTIWFSALDYEVPRHVAYAYRMGNDQNRPWIYLGENHSIALSQLKPGTYQLVIRSTNSDGVWCNNERMLTIIVKPTFWETPWALLLIVLTVAVLTAAVLYIIYYIRRLKRQQHETLEKYLTLLEQSNPVQEEAKEEKENQPQAIVEEEPLPDENDDALMKKLFSFIEDNLSDSDISIDDIAKACNVSRTSLHRKVKSMTGTSPMEFMREARIRKATQLLTHSNKSISEIAYGCGFTDPKYFSKCFKATTGQTPSEFKGHLASNT